MRHRIHHRKLGRTMEHRKALRRNMAQSLFEHGQVRTTLEKAKDIRPFAERLITLARKARQGDLQARRRIHRLMGERYFIPREHQGEYTDMSDAQRRATRQSRSGRRHRTGQSTGSQAFTTEAVSHRLIETVASRFEDRPGGYTRIIRLGRHRIGDAGTQALLQLVGEEDVPSNVPKPAKSARRRRIEARFAAMKKAVRAAGGKSRGESAAAAEPPASGGSSGGAV